MNKTLIFIFIFSLGWFSGLAQDSENLKKASEQDSIVYYDVYGLRLGTDIVKLARTLYDADYSGFEIQGDYRFNENIYFAAEIGHENIDYDTPYLELGTEGNYLKLGLNYNTYENLWGLQNELFVGFRYGFSSFTQRLYRYIIYKDQHYFPIDIREPNREIKGLTAHFAELQLGIKVEIFKNIFLGVYVQAKYMITQKEPENFDNLYIPGFNRTYDTSNFGAGWGYSISYLIPFKKIKHKRVK